MAANSSLSLTSLDFDTLKANYKTFLKSQSNFKDYNFEASNINVLLDVITYNSYLNAFYLNMTASEMFLDSAQKYDSIVSHAKELNYLPFSAKSSISFISFTATGDGFTGLLNIPRETKFIGVNSNGTFTFTTNKATSYTSSNSTFNIRNLPIYEGTYFQDNYLVDYNIESQKFVLSNKNIDLTSLEITVIEDGLTNTIFTPVTSLFGLQSNSNVYFLQGAQNYQYELAFGDNLFGRYPKHNAIITARYRICNGADADGISQYTLADNINSVNGGTVFFGTITANTSSGGSSQQSLESVRFYAPRAYAAQQRAVASDDYRTLIMTKYGGIISDVNVYGGQLLTPKKYGRVAVCLKPTTGLIAPDFIKTDISNYMLEYVSIPTRIIVTDPDYLYIKIATEVEYNPTVTNKFSDEIIANVLDTVKSYSTNNLESFNKDFRYSRFVSLIDSTDPSIISNSTTVKLAKRISPLLGYPNSFVLDFNNAAETETPDPSMGYNDYSAFGDEPVLVSSEFTYLKDGVEYPKSRMREDNKGNVIVYTTINGVFTPLDTVGTINYTTGYVIIQNFTVTDYTSYISVEITPKYDDILVDQSKILIIDVNDVTITASQLVV